MNVLFREEIIKTLNTGRRPLMSSMSSVEKVVFFRDRPTERSFWEIPSRCLL